MQYQGFTDMPKLETDIHPSVYTAVSAVLHLHCHHIRFDSKLAVKQDKVV